MLEHYCYRGGNIVEIGKTAIVAQKAHVIRKFDVCRSTIWAMFKYAFHSFWVFSEIR